jgi:hypothetical protein
MHFFLCSRRKKKVNKWKERLFMQLQKNLDDDEEEECFYMEL